MESDLTQPGTVEYYKELYNIECEKYNSLVISVRNFALKFLSSGREKDELLALLARFPEENDV